MTTAVIFLERFREPAEKIASLLDAEMIPAESVPRVQVGTDWRKATDAEVLQALGVGSP